MPDRQDPRQRSILPDPFSSLSIGSLVSGWLKANSGFGYDGGVHCRNPSSVSARNLYSPRTTRDMYADVEKGVISVDVAQVLRFLTVVGEASGRRVTVLSICCLSAAVHRRPSTQTSIQSPLCSLCVVRG